jgi:hypothetical protein
LRLVDLPQERIVFLSQRLKGMPGSLPGFRMLRLGLVVFAKQQIVLCLKRLEFLLVRPALFLKAGNIARDLLQQGVAFPAQCLESLLVLGRLFRKTGGELLPLLERGFGLGLEFLDLLFLAALVVLQSSQEALLFADKIVALADNLVDLLLKILLFTGKLRQFLVALGEEGDRLFVYLLNSFSCASPSPWSALTRPDISSRSLASASCAC